jgi:hypothetical protein
MSTATTRSHVAHRRSLVETSPRGYTLYIRDRKGLQRVELTRRQAQALADLLEHALARSRPQPLELDHDRWLDPEIM